MLTLELAQILANMCAASDGPSNAWAEQLKLALDAPHLVTIDLRRIAAIRHSAGWTAPNHDNLDQKLLLVVSEVCEIQNERRDGHAIPDIYYKLETGFWCKAHHRSPACTDCRLESEWERYELSKPEGIPIEMVDVIMRLADIAFCHGVDLQHAMELKLKYNATRPYQHGGRKF